MTTDTSAEALERQRFEEWITSPPFEKDVQIMGAEAAWPGDYLSYEVQLAWCAWKAALAAEKRRAREGVNDDIEARLDTVLAAMRRLYLHYKDQPCGTDFGRMVRLLELAQQKRALYELAQQSQELGLYEDTDHD